MPVISSHRSGRNLLYQPGRVEVEEKRYAFMGCGEGGIDADTGGIIKTSPRRIEQLIAKNDSSIEGVVVDDGRIAGVLTSAVGET